MVPPTIFKVKVSLMHVGWKCLRLPGDKSYTVVKVEVTGLQNSVRVRQLQVLVHPSNSLDCALSSVTAQQQACEAQALRVFRLLTSQVCIYGSIDPCCVFDDVIGGLIC